MSSSEPRDRGSLIKFMADCGHWMDCYAKEPTPTECPDCAKKSVGWGLDDWGLG
jgi:hypothetical protein